MKRFLADLHIHTALSPCAADEMTPPAIVRAALERGLSLIAVCDHNAAGNVAATQRAASVNARGEAVTPPLTVLAGIEITTAEEVHVVGLFASAGAAEAVAQVVGAALPEADAAYYERFGEQHLLDAAGRIVGRDARMLALASTLELTAAVALVHQHGGLAIAAHVNRPSFSVLSQLGVFPRDAGFDALEVFAPCDGGRMGGAPGATAVPAVMAHATLAPGATAVPAVMEYAGLGWAVIASSDSHFLADIGRARTIFEMAAATFDELALALRGVGGKQVHCA